MTAVQASPAPPQSTVRGSGLNLLGSLSLAVSNVLLLAVVTRGLGAGGAGAFLSAVALITIVMTVVTLGADTGLIRVLARPSVQTAAEVRRMLLLALAPVVAVGAVSGLALWAAAPMTAGLVGDVEHADEIATYLRSMAPFVPLGAVMLALLGATRGLQTMTPTVVVDRLLRPGLQIAACGAVVVLGGRGTGLGLAWAAPYAAGLVLAIWWCQRLVRRRGMVRIQMEGGAAVPADLWADARDFWRFTAPRALASGMQVLMQWLDVLLVGAFLSTRDAGIYAVASRVIQLGFYVGNAVGQAIQPRLAALFASGDRAALEGIYRSSTMWTVLVVWPVFLIGGIAAPVLLQPFGPEFVAGAAAVSVLAVSGLLASGVGSVDMVLLMAGRSSANLTITAVALVGNVGLNLLLIPRFGIVGAASAWAASRIVAKLLSLRHVVRHVGVHPFGPAVTGTAGVALLCYGAVGMLTRAVTALDLMSVSAYLLVGTALYGYLLRDRVSDARATLTRSPRPPQDTSQRPASSSRTNQAATQ